MIFAPPAISSSTCSQCVRPEISGSVIGYILGSRNPGTLEIEQRLHHQKAVFAVVVVLRDPLNDGVTGLAIESLGDGVADTDLEHYRGDLAFHKHVLKMLEELFGDAAAAVLGRDADGRQVGGVVLVDHDEGESYHFAAVGDRAIAQRLWLVQKIVESVLCIVISIAKT